MSRLRLINAESGVKTQARGRILNTLAVPIRNILGSIGDIGKGWRKSACVKIAPDVGPGPGDCFVDPWGHNSLSL